MGTDPILLSSIKRTLLYFLLLRNALQYKNKKNIILKANTVLYVKINYKIVLMYFCNVFLIQVHSLLYSPHMNRWIHICIHRYLQPPSKLNSTSYLIICSIILFTFGLRRQY